MGRSGGVFPLVMKPVLQLAVLAAIAASGMLLAQQVWGETSVDLSGASAIALSMVFLTIGLGIDPQEAREHWRLVALVLIVGVPAKFALTLWLTGVFANGTPDPAMIMAISQVDAISVALIMANSWMSGTSKAAMSIIALSDDPWTGLLAESINAFNGEGAAGLVPYVVFFGGVALLTILWWVKRSWLTMAYNRVTHLPDWLLTVLMVGGVATAAITRWYFVAAIIGLLFQPKWLGRGLTRTDRALLRHHDHDEQEKARTWSDVLGKVTLCGAFFLLGFALAGGGLADNPRMGATMGSVVFFSHAFVLAVLLLVYRTRFIGGVAGKHVSLRDAMFMMAAHQNGLTAFALTLGLGLAVGVVAVSVVTTFAWYMATNILLFIFFARRSAETVPIRR